MNKTVFFAFIGILLLLTFASCKQEGCTDPDAVNFDADADTENNTCVYPADLYEGIYTWADTVVRTDNNTGQVTTQIYTNSGGISKADKTLVDLNSMLSTCSFGKALVSENTLTLLSLQTCDINGVFSFDGTNLVFDYTTSDFWENQHHKGVAVKQP